MVSSKYFACVPHKKNNIFFFIANSDRINLIREVQMEGLVSELSCRVILALRRKTPCLVQFIRSLSSVQFDSRLILAREGGTGEQFGSIAKEAPQA